MSVYSTAYSFDQWLSVTGPEMKNLPGDMLREIPTALIRQYPRPWQLFAQFYDNSPYELVQSFEYHPTNLEVGRSMQDAIDMRSLGR